MGFIIWLLSKCLTIYSFVLVVYALLSWFPNAYNSAFGRFIVRISEPYLRIFQRLPLHIGMIDFSVVVALLVLDFGGSLILRLLMTIAY